MRETVSEHLLHQLEHYHPHTLLIASNQVPPPIRHWAEENGAHLTVVNAHQHDWHNLGRYDFAIVADYLEHLHKPEALHKLAQLRNLHSQRIWVLVSKEGPWTFGDFIGLGFQRCGEFDQDPQQPPMVCYGYDLASYNRVRAWNNPRFWANPENWNKYRW